MWVNLFLTVTYAVLAATFLTAGAEGADRVLRLTYMLAGVGFTICAAGRFEEVVRGRRGTDG